MRRAAAIAAAMLAACGPEVADDALDTGSLDLGTCDATGGVEHWVITSLRFARIDDGVSDGFDLDDDATGFGGTEGCGQTDLTSLDGVAGVDNAFGGILPLLENTEFIAAESLLDEVIRNGELLMLGEIAGRDHAMDDSCVDLALRRAAGTPLIGTDGEMLAHQTFDLDLDFPGVTFDDRELAHGSVDGRGFEIVIPVQILEAAVELRMVEAALRFDLHDDGTATGILAGGLVIDEILAELDSQGNVDQALKDVARSAVEFAADLVPDENGDCTALSIVFAFEATPVFLYDDALEEMP